MAGGLAGTLQQALAAFDILKIGQPRRLSSPRRVGETTLVSPSPTREGETVNVIMP